MINSIRYLRLFTSLHLTVVFIPHHLSMIQLRQLVDFILIEITPLEEPLGCHKKLLIGWLLGVGNDTINYNMKIIMSGFSRKLVLLLVTIIWQSSLGTNSALKDFSNVTTKNLGQNGYYKLPDGLMIQWGYSSSSGRNKTIYLPTSFYDTIYSVIITMRRGTDDTTNLTGDVWTQSKSSFLMFGLYHATDINNGAYWAGFNWLAIGRWK